MKHVHASFVCMCQRSCLQHRTWEEMFGESTGKLGLKMTIVTHTDERKMVNLYFLVPVCVLSVFKFIFINWSTLPWSGEKSHCTLVLNAQWCNHTWFFRHTAKNLVVYATSWSLTLSPAGVHGFTGKTVNWSYLRSSVNFLNKAELDQCRNSGCKNTAWLLLKPQIPN